MGGHYAMLVRALEALKFQKEKHRFTVNGKWVPSVSKVGRQWIPPFDEDKWSAHVAKKRGITQEAVLAEWKLKRDTSTALGEEVHTAIELFLDPPAEFDGALDMHMDNMSPEAHVRFAAWVKHVAPRIEGPAIINDKPAIEMPTFHMGLGYAGINDLLAETKAGLWVFDWKTSGEFTFQNKYGDTLLPPFQDLPNSDFVCYSIQSCLLRMAWESLAVPIAGAALVWLGPGGAVKTRMALDLRQRLADALTPKVAA